MPIYNYECKKCGTVFEYLNLNKEAVQCPKCRSFGLRRLISRVAVRTRGISEPDYDKGIITQKGADPKKEYETIHDVPVGYLNAK